MLAHFAVFSHVSPFLFFCGADAAETTKEHPKPTSGRVVLWQDAQRASPHSEPLGTMPSRAGEAELARRDSESAVLPERFFMRNDGFGGIGHNESLTIFRPSRKRMRRDG
jgi:hypothetical protein